MDDIKDTNIDNNSGDDKELDYFNKTVKDIMDDTGFETNSRKEREEVDEKSDNEEDGRGEVKEKADKEEDNTDPDKDEDSEESDKEGIESTKILGKTEEEINEIINKRTQEAVKKHEDSLKDYYEAQKNEMTVTSQMKEVEQLYNQYEDSVKELEKMMQQGRITPQQYREAINNAVQDMHVLKDKYSELQLQNQKVGLPKIKRSNDEYYQKLQEELPEFKDPIIKKYADNLKTKVYDAGGIDLAQGGFNEYVRDFIAAAVREAEIRGYQKIKNEIQNRNAKAKAKSVVPNGGKANTGKPSIQTADDILNASKDDLLRYIL